MAFDGIVMAALGNELRTRLLGGVISKIAMPEKDELLLTIRNNGNNYRLLISAGASLPLIYLTEENRNSPLTAPAFCMLLRKYIGTGKVVGIRQQGLERILTIDVEHRNDLGDLCVKKLVLEMMGKYSNIIFTTSEDIIIDSIKRVPSSVSSLREVLPGRRYCFPKELTKKDILSESREGFTKTLSTSEDTVVRTIFICYAGISPFMAGEFCARAGVEPELMAYQCDAAAACRLWDVIIDIRTLIENAAFTPSIIKRKDEPVEFAPFKARLYESQGYESESCDSVSRMLESFYGARNDLTRIRQRSADIRKITANALERAVKKYDLQEKQLKDCKNKDIYKIYGDLLNTYGYSLKGGEKSFTCNNYYDADNEITIPLDPHKSAAENAKRYFDRYSKLRRTGEALNIEIVKTQNDIEHLQSILQSIETSKSESDLIQIRNELEEYGYLKHHDKKAKNSGNRSDSLNSKKSQKSLKSQPLMYTTSDGYRLYVGKNNYQNEEVTFKIASGGDWWFHAKGVPGSHVILKTEGNKQVSDKAFEEAASLAAFYSQNRNSEKAEVDYTLRKNLKRVAGGPPGFVIYHTNFSIVVRPGIVKQI